MGVRKRLLSQNLAKVLGQHILAKKRILDAVARENYKSSALGTAGILACAIGRTKEVAFSESREIARVAYLGQITIIGNGRT